VVFMSNVADNQPMDRDPSAAQASREQIEAEIQRQLQLFGWRLTQTYTEAGMSKRALALATPFDRHAITEIEQGLRVPGFGKLMALARAMGSTPAALLEGIGAQHAEVPPIEHGCEPPADPVRRFGANLKWIRERREPRMTQEGLALEANIDRSSPNGYETGRMRPNLETILKLAWALGVTPSLLLEGVELRDRK
jgi:transcriptional regulator with XRE-family HTH domain